MYVEFSRDHVVIATPRPRFSWEVPRGVQRAYRLFVATSREKIGERSPDAWDSGWIDSSQSTGVVYEGPSLHRDTDYFWGVDLRLDDEREIPIDSIGSFSTSPYADGEWDGQADGQWIGLADPDEPHADPSTFQQDRVAPEVAAFEPDPRSPMLRRSFLVEKPVARAVLLVCGLGLCEPRLNGAKVGDAVLAPSRTEFRTRALYSLHIVTDRLTPGENVMGLILGNGWFNGQRKYWGWQMQWYGSPRALVELRIEYADGSRESIRSDADWQAAWSPITASCIYDGESYDARMEQDGWDQSRFDAAGWEAAQVLPAPGGSLCLEACEAERVVETIPAVGVEEAGSGVFVFDLGVNMTGWVRLLVRDAPAGTDIRLRFAEAVLEDGSIDRTSAGRALQEDHYITSGGSAEWEPRFTFHGFRYVEVSGYPGTPTTDAIQGRFARVDVAQSGSFECSDPLITRIHAATRQSQLCNIQMGVPTDDTQRPERLGWGADAWATAIEALYNLWMPRLYEKWIGDFRDQQDESGMVGMIAPQAGAEEDLPWSSAFLLIPWWHYQHYGDERILRDNIEPIRRYLDYLERCGVSSVDTMEPEQLIERLNWRCGPGKRFPLQEERGLLQISQWGDHLATAEGSATRANLPLSMATAFYFLDVVTAARIARVLGETEMAHQWETLAERIRQAFTDRFYDSSIGYYDNGAQSAQAWPLAFGLVPESERERVARYFVDLIERKQRHLTTGYASTKFAIHALSALGRDDLVWMLARRIDYPSWGYMLSHDRTTSCETWDGETGSFNHAPLGAAIDEWFYWGLAGIRPDPAGPGFARMEIRPFVPPDLAHVTASVRTMRGTVSSAWRQQAGTVALTVGVPGNSEAVVVMPQQTETVGPGTWEFSWSTAQAPS